MKKQLLLLVVTVLFQITLLGQVNNNKADEVIRTETQKRDYQLLALQAIDTTERYLYNPSLITSDEWRNFKREVLTESASCFDDRGFLTLFNKYGSQLPFTHFGLSLKRVSAQSSDMSTVNRTKPQNFELKVIDSLTVLFTVRSFSAGKEEIEPYIDTLKSMKYSNLIIDLRNNTGGTIASALPLASYLVQDTLYGGAFLTQKYFSKHSQVPSTAEYLSFPHFSEASFALIISGIHNQEGLCLVVNPDENNFKGNLYILTNRYTASTCEPLVYGLQQSGRAKLVGQKTCGAMLNGEQFIIGGEFNLWVPTADFYASDGYRIDRQGVIPDIVTEPEEALDKALELIGKTETGGNGDL